IRLAPRPPYSLGQEIPAQPPSYSLCCQRFRYSKRDSIDSSRRSSQSVGALAWSQPRNSSRNLISSGLRFRSIGPPGAQAPSPVFHQNEWPFILADKFTTLFLSLRSKPPKIYLHCELHRS